jgi:2-hydroxychromene-2-carboxylate isomerase
MTESVQFFYDPQCPWAWRTSKWVRRLEEDGVVQVDWRFFSLGVINSGSEDVMDDTEDVGAASLRTLAFVKKTEGNQKSGELYAAMGEQSHEVMRRLTTRLVGAALSDTGLGADLIDQALADPGAKEDVLMDHRAAASSVGAFGVPTIVLESGKGIFGPVLDDVGADDPHELWTHVRWLIEKVGFHELKRERG